MSSGTTNPGLQERELAKLAALSAALAAALRERGVGEWDSQEALDAHYRSEAFARFQLDLHGLLSQPSDMTIYAVADRVRPVNTRPMDPRDAD
jgi:hypothetical protein